MEGVIALEDGLDTPIGGAPGELDSFGLETGTTGDTATTNAEAHLDKVLRLLKASGVDFPSTPSSPAKHHSGNPTANTWSKWKAWMSTIR